MRVNITYSVELDKVPTSVSGIISQTVSDLKTLEFRLEKTGTGLKHDPDTSKALEKINSIRKELTEIDYALADSMAILVGYQKAVSESYLPDEQEEVEVSDVVEAD